MFFPVLLIFFFISKVQSGELLIAKTPPSLKFQGSESIDQHLVPEILSTALGFTVQQDLHWNGVTITSPFSFAKALIVIYVDGASSLENSEDFKKFVLINDESEYSTWKMLRDKIMNRYPMTNASITELNFELTKNFTSANNEFLKSSTKEELEFFNEINNLNNIVANVKKSEGMYDFQWFSLRSLYKLSLQKGALHPAVREAKMKVYKSIKALSEVYSLVYGDQVLVVTLISDPSHTRRARNVISSTDTFDSKDNRDNIYNPDFPVIFNIILWFTVALIFVLIAVSVFIASMDPGRDSIIYRMTSNRMKKDS